MDRDPGIDRDRLLEDLLDRLLSGGVVLTDTAPPAVEGVDLRQLWRELLTAEPTP